MGRTTAGNLLSFVAAKEVGRVLTPALARELFVALGHALNSVQKLGAVLEPALELVIGINLAADFPEMC